MKIKNKLRLGFGFLFAVVLAFGITAMIYINKISENSKVILKNNYETLSFTRQMRSVLDDNALPLSATARQRFDQELVKQEHNITEKGEGEATAQVRNGFTSLSGTGDKNWTAIVHNIRLQLRKIDELNMSAIVRKNDRAQASVDHATLLLALVGTFTFLILFSFSVNFPGFIANPLRALIDGIREISHENYNQKLNFHQDDEFAEVAIAFNDMAARLTEWENSNLAKLLSEKQRIETIIEQMDDAIIGLNEKQEILFINTVAERVLNLNEAKLVGQSAEKFTATNDLFKTIIENKSPIKPFKIAMNGKESYFQLESREIVIPNLTDKKRADELSIAQKSAGKVYILRNVTEYKERDEAKTNFIATISHELKTPISAIKMSLKLLKDDRIGAVNSQQLELLEHISEDSNRLLKITSELLDLSQVETGNIQLNFIPSPPAGIVDYALGSVRFAAEQKQIELQVDAQPGIPNVYVDMEKTAWVMVNFLSNALRYSPERSKIMIGIRQNGDEVVFSVKDKGKGIDEQYQQRLFDRYFQVPTDGQNKSGSGLGLAISKDFIEAQQGRIWVESAIGEGSTFYFSLPVHSAMVIA